MMENLLEINHLTKHFKDFSLTNVSFQLPKGYIMGFIGPNGAGKSTTIKLIMNLLKRESGEVKVCGLDNLKHEREIKNRIGFVYDENHFYEELTIGEMKRVIAPIYQQWDDALFHRYLRDFGLKQNKRIKDLSRGMKVKFSLAVALSHGADLLIMDEPTSGLDPVVRSELLEILSSLLQDENKGVFFSTHITSDLDRIADYITLLHEGKVVFSRSKDEIMEQHVLIKGGLSLLQDDLRRELVGVRKNRFGFEALSADKGVTSRLQRAGAILDKPTLEDIMLFYTRRDLHA